MSAIGIDLGTTFSAAAGVAKNGEPYILHNREGHSTTPSVVCFRDDKPVVGMAARRSVTAAPTDCVEFVKRYMGDPTWRFPTASGEEFSAEQISAMILKRVAEDASAALGEPASEAVITVPAYFDDARRKATADAGEIAGLDVLRVLNEPTAAALAFGYNADREETLLVYDLGGGTFDCTVMRMGHGRFDVLATAGDRNLGGFDFDNALMIHVSELMQKATGLWLLSPGLDDGETEAVLREHCEQAKRQLSTLPEAKISMEVDGGDHMVTVTRPTFEALTRPLLRRTEEIVQEVMEEAGIGFGRLGSVLMVGGSTRMPMVTTMVEKVTGVRADRSVHPDEAVALGAAVLADVLSNARRHPESRPRRTVTVNDVTSQGVGVVARARESGEQVNSIVIPRNTPIPCQGRRRFRTLAENQREVLLVVTEGDDTDLRFATVVGSARLAIPQALGAVEFDIVISYDEDGIIHVSLTEPGDNDRQIAEFEIDRQANLDAADIHRMRAALRSLEVG
ncbi:Hsp70 family protein [Cryptosporangium arvum]|uniref:Hsp70 family protein n=1 Tax=Cryptosporangium arvum TaxID=80871 RepID=UPI0004ACAC44|nr:Hsp70 family protein [Cryptosporangium arvum]